MGYQIRPDRQEKIQWLQRFRQVDSEIVSCREEIQYWREKSNFLTSCYHEMKVKGGEALDLGDVAARIMDVETQLKYKLMRLVLLRQEIRDVIGALPSPRLRHLLELRYLHGVTMEEIAQRMHYSWRQVQRLHNQALDLLEGDFQLK